MLTIIRRRWIAPLVLTLAAGVGACDNPVDGEEEHAVGLLILNAQGQEVARVRIGGASEVTGQIAARVSSTQTFQLFALSDEGERITIDGNEYSLVATAPAAAATVALVGANQVTIRGNQVGTSAVTFTLNHEGHAEFVRPVPLVVTP